MPPKKKKPVAAKKATVKKTVSKKTPAKASAKAAPAKKTAPKKAAAKKPVAKKAAPKKAAPKKAAPKKAVAKKPVAKKAPAKKPAVKKAVVKKAAPKKAAPKKTPIAKKRTALSIVKKPAQKPAVKKTLHAQAQAKKPANVKKAGVKSTAKSGTATKTAAKSHLSVVPSSKKPLAPTDKTEVKASASTVSRITPIKAPAPVAPRPKTIPSANKDMTLPIVPPDYEPTDTEEFMNPIMREYFRQRLIAWRDELLRESEETLHVLQEEGNMQKPDITDRASEETDLAIEFRTRDRERKLLNKINEAMGRVEDGSYGYCEETGDPIPVKRLIARPTAVRTLEAEELHERRERTQRDQYE